jgi:hypothetical protein
MTKPLVLSYGGGTQTIAMAVLIRQGRLPKPDIICIADTGREASETWEYKEKYVDPMLAEIGLSIHVIPHSTAAVDLYENNGKVLIPAFSENGMLQTFCSGRWKRDVVKHYLRNELHIKECTTWIGISLDEIGRLKPSGLKWQEFAWPLVFDIPMRRSQCKQLVIDYGLPPPPRSSCWMCPHRKDEEWIRLRDYSPDDFAKACQLDEEIRVRDKRGGLFLHDSHVPLAQVVFEDKQDQSLPLFGGIDGCDSGFCWV